MTSRRLLPSLVSQPLNRLAAKLWQLSPYPGSRVWLQSLAVIGLMLFAFAVPYIPSRFAPLLLLALIGAGAIVIFALWPPIGLIVASIVGLVVPYVGPSGLNITAILIALLVGLWLLDMITRRRRIWLMSLPTVWLALGFLIIALLSFGVGQLPWFNFALHAPLGAQLGGLAIVVLSIGTFLLAAHVLQDWVWLRRLTWAFLAFAALSVLVRSVLPTFGLSVRSFFQPVGSGFYIWLTALAAGQAVFNRDLRPASRLALGALVLVTLYILLFQKFNDKSGWIPPLFCLATILFLRSWRIGLLLIPVGLLLFFYLTGGGLDSEGYSISTRIDAWIIMAQIVKVNPILGLGFANYYWYTPLFAIRGYAVSFNSHNNYVDIVAQMGLAGLAFYVLILAGVGWLAWQLRERLPAGFRQAYVYSVIAGLVGTVVVGMLGDWVIPFFYNIGLYGFRTSMLTWLFLGGLVSLQQVALRQRPKA
jgi:hypothetical protein